MKRMKLLAGIAMVGFLAFGAKAATLQLGSVHFRLTALQQDTDHITSRTNKTAAGTNITTTTKSSVTTKAVSDKDILKLLANSLTNLPASTTNASSHLATDGNGNFYVVTATSTNNVSSVLSISFNNSVSAGSETTVTKLPSTLLSVTESLTTTQVAQLTYDDTGHFTRDGTHTTLTFNGLLVARHGDRTTTFTLSFTLTGQGDGTVRNVFTVINGSVTGDLTGSTDFDD